MKKARRWIVLIFMVVALVSLGSSVFAQGSDEASRDTLRDLQGIYILVERLRPEIERTGKLTENQLRMGTELKLRKSDIKVLSLKESLRMPGMPYLYVYVNVFKSKHRSLYVYNITVALVQAVSLIRAPNVSRLAITWSVSGIGAVRELERIRGRTEGLVDDFIDAYLSVNPK